VTAPCDIINACEVQKGKAVSDLFRIAYFEAPPHPAFLDAMSDADRCTLVRVPKETETSEALRLLATCDGYYARAARDELPQPLHVTEAFLQSMPRLLLVSSYGAGYDTVDPAACTRHGVAVCNQGGGNAEAVVEHALAFMLALLKRIPDATTAIAAGTAGDRRALMGRELFGKTVGIVGIGHIGTRMARVLSAFDCRILAVDPYLDAATMAARGAEKLDLPDLLAQSDVVTAHCPLTSETRGMIGQRELQLMKPGAFFVNTARGGIHDEAALLSVLQDGHLAGAGLDVWEREPPSADNPLVLHPAVIATSHTAGVTHESRTRLARMAAETFKDLSEGRLPPRIVNQEVEEVLLERLRTRHGPV
jgi:D-3-phosphoglycerate dehydrogenase / 2-oxoglutarate reductase